MQRRAILSADLALALGAVLGLGVLGGLVLTDTGTDLLGRVGPAATDLRHRLFATSPAADQRGGPEPVRAPVRTVLEGGRVVVRLSHSEQARIGVETARRTRLPHPIEIQAYGSVVDPARVTDLTNSYAGAVAALQAAKARAEVSGSAARRSKSLSAGVVTAAQIEVTEGTAITDQAAVIVAESQIRTLAATAQQEWGPVIGKAIVERSPVVTRLIERIDFLVQVTLPPGETLKAPPAMAFAEVPPQSERVPLRYVSPATRTDQRVQGISSFYTVAGNSGLLPGMSTLAFLTSDRKTPGLSIPESAVVHWQGGAWFYRDVGEDAFVRHPLKIDAPISADTYIVDDLGPEAHIIVTGPQAVLSEELRGQIQAAGDTDND
ncbi:efflux RND transporter periplasmic adaptor subunit [Methylobacterium sp. J-090]|uniref:efflux RND transporter periplasmic adaptor subunit n=1 Tax=Methylobacterium sp. J-090 TaxID=2836666 RepID=UPI001FB935F1|nr:efflux RND transporter periplasmic adaptor subunit [Methylobacterium sp. J-090]MCJ2083539.1 efflux RND transporter periplasmic adaptor subunit [Methylobacterium sp. J-090]